MGVSKCVGTFDAGHATAKGKRDQALSECAAIQDPVQRLACEKEAVEEFEEDLQDLAAALLACIKGVTS